MAKSAADRQRVHRERQRRGLLKANVWLPTEVVEAMIDAGLIIPEMTADPDALGELSGMAVISWVRDNLSASASRRYAQSDHHLDKPKGQSTWAVWADEWRSKMREMTEAANGPMSKLLASTAMVPANIERKDGDPMQAVAAAVDELTESFKVKMAKLDDLVDVERKARQAVEMKLNRLTTFGFQNSEGVAPEAAAEMKAIGDFVRNGGGDWAQEPEIKAISMQVGVDPNGGFVVTPHLSTSMTKRLFDLSPMRRLARVEIMTTGDAWEEPDDRGEAAAQWVSEKQSRPDTDASRIGMHRVPLNEIYAQPKATQRVLDDANRDLGAWLEGKISDAFGRSEGLAFIAGDGVRKPTGLLSYPTATEADFARQAGKIQYLASGNATGLGATPADLVRKLMWMLRTPYRAGAVWLMNSNTASFLDSLKDGQGNYIWRTGMTTGAPASLLGYPVEIDEGMPDIGAGAFPIAFGNFQHAYLIVDRPGLKLIRDPYTDKPNVKFYATRRVGGGLMNDDAVKLIKVATS